MDADKEIIPLEELPFQVDEEKWGEANGAELSPAARKLAEITDDDRAEDIHQTMGYLFFPKPLSAVPLYELLKYDLHPGLEAFITSGTALLAAIWTHCPEYAVSANMQEQMGIGDGNLL